MLITILITLIQALLIIRFHLELARVNALIEPVNTIRKLTNPLVMPVKRLLPWAKTTAAIWVVVLITVLALLLLFPQAGLFSILINSVLFVISTWLMVLQYGMFLYVIGSWIQIPALQRSNYLLYSIFQPMLRPIQKILPSFAGLDFSPMVFLLLVWMAGSFINGLING